jgi:hypothetical protein
MPTFSHRYVTHAKPDRRRGDVATASSVYIQAALKRELRAFGNGTALNCGQTSDVIAEASDARASGREDVPMATPKSAITDKQAPFEFFKGQLPGESPLSFATAERLFAGATGLIAIRPWESLEDQHLVLLKSPLSNEICYCSIMGALGEVFSLHAYVGDESYRYFRKMAAGKPISIGEFYGSLRGFYVEFVGLSELTSPDRELARTFGHPLKRGLKAPIFRALRPGYHPWYPTENEGIILAECIGGVLAFCERLRKGDAHDYWKDAGVFPFMVPVEVEQDRKRFDIEMVKVPEPVAATPQPTRLDADRTLKILEKNYPRQGAFEVEQFYAAGMVGKRDERKACIRIGLVADASSGFVFPPELAMPERATADIIATAVLNAIDTAQCLPREICVNQRQFRTFLEPLASKLGLAVRTVKRLPALQRAKEELLAMMGDPGPFVS